MKPLLLYLCLFTVLFQAIFASSSLNGSASLSTNKTAPLKGRKSHSKAKPAVGKPVWKKKLPSIKKKVQNKRRKRKNVLVKEDKPILLINLLPKELVKLVIDYFIDINLYPIIVSTHNWIFQKKPEIAVDNARLYVMADAEGIKGLDHALANTKDERLIEFGDPKWSNYSQFRSSCDGRCVSFRHKYVWTNFGEQIGYAIKWLIQGNIGYGIKWLIQGNESEDGRPKRVAFGGEDLDESVLLRDGQTLCAYSYEEWNPITRVYRVREEAGKDPVAFGKFKLDGTVRAVSGNGNHVVIAKPRRLEIHDIIKDASNPVCQIYVSSKSICALNEDGSEAAFFNKANELRIMKVDKVIGVKTDQPAIIKVKVPKSVGQINQLVYDDGGKLHAHHDGGKISLFDPSTKELILPDAPEKGQEVTRSAISPNADYIAFLVPVGEKDGKTIYETIVKGKLRSVYLERLFGYKADKKK